MDRTKDKQKFQGLMAMLQENFNTETSAKKLELYFKVFESYAIEVFEEAVYLAIKTLKFYPKVADLLEIIEGRAEEKSLIAWQRVLEALRITGTYQSVKFEDSLIHYCIQQMGGWSRFSTFTDEDLIWREKQFRELYQVGDRHKEHLEIPDHIAGFFEEDNRSKGFDNYIPKPSFYPKALPEPKKEILKIEKAK